MNTKEFQGAINEALRGRKLDRTNPYDVLDTLTAKVHDLTTRAKELGVSHGECEKIQGRLVAEAEIQWMRTYYPTIDFSFMEGKMQSVACTEVGGYQILRAIEPTDELAKNEFLANLPVFTLLWNSYENLAAFYSGERDIWRASFKYEVPVKTIPRGRGRSIDVTATTPIPSGLTPGMFRSIRLALAMLDLFKLACRVRDLAVGKDEPQVGILWAPTLEAWSLTAVERTPKGDPAILVRGGDDGPAYFVGYYDTPDEKPIENLIREFTTGPARKRLSGKKSR